MSRPLAHSAAAVALNSHVPYSYGPPTGGVRERPPVLATAASGQDKYHPVYPGTRTVYGAIWDRLGGA